MREEYKTTSCSAQLSESSAVLLVSVQISRYDQIEIIWPSETPNY